MVGMLVKAHLQLLRQVLSRQEALAIPSQLIYHMSSPAAPSPAPLRLWLYTGSLQPFNLAIIVYVLMTCPYMNFFPDGLFFVVHDRELDFMKF